MSLHSESKTASKSYQKYVEQINKVKYCMLPSTSGLNACMTFEKKIDSCKELAATAQSEL